MLSAEAGLIPRSSCTIKGAGTERHAEMQAATPDQVAHLAEAAGPRWEALILTAAYVGLRWGELAGLRRSDLGAGTVTVARKLAEVNGDLSFSPPKTAADKRTVGIPSFVVRSLQVHLGHHAELGAKGLVFPAPEGPMRRSNFRRRVWEPATTEAGVSGLRFHDLRHTAATLAAASGTSLKALMARIGHASPSSSPPLPTRHRRPRRRHRPLPRTLRSRCQRPGVNRSTPGHGGAHMRRHGSHRYP